MKRNSSGKSSFFPIARERSAPLSRESAQSTQRHRVHREEEGSESNARYSNAFDPIFFLLCALCVSVCSVLAFPEDGAVSGTCPRSPAPAGGARRSSGSPPPARG